MRVIVYIDPSHEHHADWCGALAEGIRRHDDTVEITTDFAPRTADVALFWGHNQRINRVLERQQRDGAHYVALERGYLGDRFEQASVMVDGQHGLAKFPVPDECDGSRFKALKLKVYRWKRQGTYVLVLGQIPGDGALRGISYATALNKIFTELNTLREAGRLSLPVRHRPHPLDRSAPATGESLADDLKGAAVAVTINSTSGIDAALAGVPVIALDRRSMAWPVAGHDLEDVLDPPTPDREAWLHSLAWCQYSRDELRDGSVWERVRKVLTNG